MLLYQESNEGETARNKAFNILRARNALNSDFTFTTEETLKRPDFGHKSFRIRSILGFEKYNNKIERNFLILGLRPAFHNLLEDSTRGYSNNQGLEMFKTNFKIYLDKKNQIQLNNLELITVSSISPWSYPFIRPISWNFSFGWMREKFSQDESLLSPYAEGGSGLSFAINDSLLVHSFVNLNYIYNERLKLLTTKNKSNQSIRYNPQLVVRKFIGDLNQLNLEYSYSNTISGFKNSKTSIKTNYFYSINKDLNINFEYSYNAINNKLQNNFYNEIKFGFASYW